MTAATVDQLVNHYLSRLEAAAADLPDGRRTELVAEIREHIEVARSEGVAAGAEPSISRPVATVAAQQRWSGTEITAVLLLGGVSVAALALFWPLGPLVVLAAALPFVWTSSRWTEREKWIGTTIAVAPMIAAILLVLTLRSL